jgi:hypothetical protein
MPVHGGSNLGRGSTGFAWATGTTMAANAKPNAIRLSLKCLRIIVPPFPTTRSTSRSPSVVTGASSRINQRARTGNRNRRGTHRLQPACRPATPIPARRDLDRCRGAGDHVVLDRLPIQHPLSPPDEAGIIKEPGRGACLTASQTRRQAMKRVSAVGLALSVGLLAVG